MFNILEDKYLNALIAHCAILPLDGLPAAGEIFYQRIPLDDIFVPLKLSKSEKLEELFAKKTKFYKFADDEINFGNTVNETDNYVHQNGKGTSNTTMMQTEFVAVSDSEVAEFLDFIEEQINKPVSSGNGEFDAFIWQIDKQIEQLSFSETSDESGELISVKTPEELVSNLDSMLTNAVVGNASQDKNKDNIEEGIFLREQIKKYDNLPVGPILENHASRTILLALPGCGKTTLVRRISLAYASGDMTGLESYNLPENLFPVLLYCRSLNEELLDGNEGFLDVAFKMFSNQFPNVIESADEFNNMIERQLANNRLLLIIDGLDEVLSDEKQEFFAKLLLSYMTKNDKAHLLITSRLASYGINHWSTRHIERIPLLRRNRILPMDSEQIDAFIRRWHTVLYPSDVEKRCQAEDIIVQLKQPAFRYLKEMIRIPLHLANIILVAKEYNRIPNDKIQLYEDYLRIALNWNTPSNFAPEDLKIALSYVAYHMTLTGHLRFECEDLRELLLKGSMDLDGELKTPITEENVQQIINQLEERTCVIQKHGQKSGYFEFTHKNLQEYLAAYAIARGYSEELFSPVDFVSKHYSMTSWREVIILLTLTVSRMPRNTIISFLINEAETREDNYHATNILFELIANGVQIAASQKHAIYDLIFKEHITDTQIIQIGELTEDYNAEDFKSYVKTKFYESVQTGESNYAFAMAAVYSIELLKKGEKPLKEAERLVILSESAEFLTGLYIFTLLGWCKYCSIEGPFATQTITLSKAFEDRLRRSLQDETKYLSDIATSLKDIVLAGYGLNETFFDKELYVGLVNYLYNEPTTEAAEKIMSVFPINYLTLSYGLDENVYQLRAKYISKYRECLMDPKNAETAVFVFSVCLILGGWDISSEEYLTEFQLLEAYYTKSNRYADDAAKTKLKILRKQISDMADPVSAGLYHYEMSEFEKAKAAFLVAYKKGNTTVSNNLAYMLRRGEINDVVIDKKSYSVEELLQEGVIANEPLSITNYALQKAKENDGINYEVGLSIVSALGKLPKHLLNGVYSWWSDLAQKGENEGYIVLAWLIEMGVISTTPYGSIEDLKQLIS